MLISPHGILLRIKALLLTFFFLLLLKLILNLMPSPLFHLRVKQGKSYRVFLNKSLSVSITSVKSCPIVWIACPSECFQSLF